MRVYVDRFGGLWRTDGERSEMWMSDGWVPNNSELVSLEYITSVMAPHWLQKGDLLALQDGGYRRVKEVRYDAVLMENGERVPYMMLLRAEMVGEHTLRAG